MVACKSYLNNLNDEMNWQRERVYSSILSSLFVHEGVLGLNMGSVYDLASLNPSVSHNSYYAEF